MHDRIPSISAAASTASSPAPEGRDSEGTRLPLRPAKNSILSPDITTPMDRDISFLLQPEVYHPLSQLEIPSPFRSEFPSVPPGASVDSELEKLDNYIKGGHFLLAAHFSAAILTSHLVIAKDYPTIFSLFYTRLACLDLTGNTLLAAQESKALEDLNSSFYFVEIESKKSGDHTADDTKSKQLQHIAPWPLRLIAVRLQSIGFGDVRKGISGLYELGLEAKKQLARRDYGQQEKTTWKERLSDLGIRVVNTLIEMGDLDAARRTLAGMVPPEEHDLRTISRRILLQLRVGDIEAAKSLLTSAPQLSDGILDPLLEMAEGQYENAQSKWRSLRESYKFDNDKAIITQNLAICMLYVGKLNEVRLKPVSTEVVASFALITDSFHRLVKC